MYKILIVDDEEKIRALIRKYAIFEGHTVVEADDGMKAVELCLKDNFDIIIMDIMMPELDGFSAVKKIRETAKTPVIMLSARGEEYDKIFGFEIGIDDYVIKPFSPKELMMRINAIVKRTKRFENNNNEVFKYDGLNVDFAAMLLCIDGDKIYMSPKESELFFYMLRNRNIALTRGKIMTDVWGYDFCGDDRTLDTHIKLLRKSLGKYGKLIVTLRSLGYRFEV